MYSPAIITTEQAFQPLPLVVTALTLFTLFTVTLNGILSLLRYRHAQV